MLKTSVYIEVSSRSPRKTEKRYGYIIEAMQGGHPVTRAGYGSIEGTYHQATLAALIDALKRFNKPAEVHLVTSNGFVLGQFKNLKTWLKNGFTTTKGKPVSNSEEWRRIAALTAQHQVIPEQTERSSYTGWLQMELKKEVNENV